jgi:hypothetical protein
MSQKHPQRHHDHASAKRRAKASALKAAKKVRRVELRAKRDGK